jgi:predicted RNA-binding protein
MTESHHWLLITSRAWWDALREKEQWAFSKSVARRLRIKPGDIGIVYLTADGADPGIGGLVRFTDGKLWEANEGTIFGHQYPMRTRIETISQAPFERPFRRFIERLSFIQHKRNWGAHFQGIPIRELTTEDADVLKEAFPEVIA